MVVYKSLDEADENTRDAVQPLLQADEEIIAILMRPDAFQRWFDSGILRRLSDVLDSSNRVSLTDQRLLRSGPKSIQSEATYQLSSINSVETSGVGKARISISGSGIKDEFKARTKNDAKEFANEIRAQIGE